MCYLLGLPSGVQPQLQWLLNSLEGNNDGAGFTIATKSGQLITEHAVGINERFDSSWTDTTGKVHNCVKYKRDSEPMEALARRFVKLRKRHPEGPAMWHARLATGGVEDTRGCHPFKVGGGISNTVLAHNGIMFSTPKGDWRSDTRIFAEDILPNQFRKFWRPQVRAKLELEVGMGNKIIIITTNRRFMTRVNGMPSGAPFEMFILNEDMGHYTEDGAWHSNSSYEKYTSYRTYSYGSSGIYQGGLWEGDWSGHDSSNYGNWAGKDDEYSGWTPGTSPSDHNSQAECQFCKAYGTVNQYTDVCSLCKTCNSCCETEEACDCYTPMYSKQPANVPTVPFNEVAPKAITSGKPAIETTASPDEQEAQFLVDCWDEWDNSDDPAVQHMKWEEYVTLRRYELKHNVALTFESLEQMESWFADQTAIEKLKKDNNRWLESVAQAAEDAEAAEALADEALAILAEDDDEGDEPGIIRKLA